MPEIIPSKNIDSNGKDLAILGAVAGAVAYETWWNSLPRFGTFSSGVEVVHERDYFSEAWDSFVAGLSLLGTAGQFLEQLDLIGIDREIESLH